MWQLQGVFRDFSVPLALAFGFHSWSGFMTQGGCWRSRTLYENLYEIQIALSTNTVLLEHSRARSAFMIQRQSWVVLTETTCPGKPKILALYRKGLHTAASEPWAFPGRASRGGARQEQARVSISPPWFIQSTWVFAFDVGLLLMILEEHFGLPCILPTFHTKNVWIPPIF